MKHSFNIYIDGVNSDFWHSICRIHGERKILKKGERFCYEGQPAFYLGFIESGCFKRFVRDAKGKEQIVGFSFRNELLGEYFSIVDNEPSRTEIVALERSKVTVCNGDIVLDVMARHPESVMELSKRIFRQAYDRLIDIYKKSPKERYLDILHSCPEILQDISLKELASYLQITPTYLSRIRTSLLSEK